MHGPIRCYDGRMNAFLPPLDIDRLVRDTDRLVQAARATGLREALDVPRLIRDTECVLATGQLPVSAAEGFVALVSSPSRSPSA